jgi:glyoxylase-like metal-dependent hydrolase (beta-lactamase superfamily II)
VIRVVRVLAPNPGSFTLDGTNTWIVGSGPSVVVDPGPDDAGHILAVADEAEPVAAILLTHRHPDHAPGARRLAGATGAPVYAYRPEDDEERRLGPGEVVEAGEVRLLAVHTPGHAPDHLCFVAEPDHLLFTGDTVLGRGTSVIDPPEGDMAAYVRSLETLRDLEPAVIYPGHGPVVFTPKGKLDHYLRHRAQREERILAAVARGRRTPAEIVPDVYAGEAPEAMYPVAARSVLAHLIKLEREGAVARTGRHRDERFVPVQAKDCARCGRPAAPGSRFCRRCGLAALQEAPPPGAPDEASQPASD